MCMYLCVHIHVCMPFYYAFLMTSCFKRISLTVLLLSLLFFVFLFLIEVPLTYNVIFFQVYNLVIGHLHTLGNAHRSKYCYHPSSYKVIKILLTAFPMLDHCPFFF